MFDLLSQKFQQAIQGFAKEKEINENNIEKTLSIIQEELLRADVPLLTVKTFISRIKDKALGTKLVKGVSPGDKFTQIVYDALLDLFGANLGESQELKLDKKPSQILLLGLQGAGKTSFAAKLAYKFQKLKPLLVPCDLQRPAAVKQLKILAQEAQVDFLDILTQDQDSYTVTNPLELSKLALAKALSDGNNLIIYDTAGRLDINTDLMAELLLLAKQINPDEKLLVIDSLMGQRALDIASAFASQIGISGVALTKLDSDSRAGLALSIVENLKKPIKFMSIGEKIEDLESFQAERITSRVLGMGDIASLVEKIEARVKKEETEALEAELLKGNFNYELFLNFQNMLSKLGSFTSIFKMMGMGSLFGSMGLNGSKQEALLNSSQSKFAKYKIAITSMTKAEKLNPNLLSKDPSANSRKKRISKGSGLSEIEINQLVNDFQAMAKIFQQVKPFMAKANSQNSSDNNLMSDFQENLSKNQRKLLAQSGLMKSKSNPKIKKGTKPSVKSFD